MPTTAARRRVLRSLLAEQPVTSQATLVDLLAARGFAVTQATVSRDLAEIGAVKDPDGRYVLTERGEADERMAVLARALDDFASSITASGNLVVVRTPPGAAQVVAAALDAAALDGVVGTVAGDDTLLVVAAEQATGRGIAHKLEEIGANP